MQQMDLIEDYPSNIAAMLLNNEIDAGLIPVAVIPQLKEHYIISDSCIGADGDVASVCLFSEVPFNEIETIVLDYQSKTSVNLCRILLKHYWHINPRLVDAENDVAEQISGTTAAVLIGDRALKQTNISPFVTDLSGVWKIMTGLPFVFAAWVANKKLPDDFIQLFTEMNKVGINNLELVMQDLSFPYYDLPTYFTENISYTLTDEKLKGMQLFLSMQSELYI